MAFDEKLADRVRTLLADRPEISETRMFGGICFMLNGNMLCGVEKTSLMLRIGRDAYEAALAQPHCRVMDLTGRPLAGYVMVDSPGLADKRGLGKWLAGADEFVSALPPKKKKAAAKRKKRT